MLTTAHRPVLVQAVVGLLRVKTGGVYVDATVGGGGYLLAILDAGAGRVVGLDWDDEALARAEQRVAACRERVTLVRAGFHELPQVLEEVGVSQVEGVAADLGVSSDHLERAERGFSFQLDGPLDMRMDRRLKKTAADIIARASRQEIKEILKDYGQEPQAGRIAGAIVRQRQKSPIATTTDLARLVVRAKGGGRRRIHPATQTFLALRLAVNQELDHLSRFLECLPPLLKAGARVVVVSYHSLEDRLVKESFRKMARGCICPPNRPCVCGLEPVYRVLTGKPVRPDEAEVAENPRARSASLRAAERL